MNHTPYDPETGKPLDRSYLECGLPDDLQASIREMQKSWTIIDNGEKDPVSYTHLGQAAGPAVEPRPDR